MARKLNYNRQAMQRGVTLVELVLVVTISAILMGGLNSIVKLGLDAQAIGRSRNELAYQWRFALERIAEKARNTAPKELSSITIKGSSSYTNQNTGDWFAPVGCTGVSCVMYCRNATTNQLIETTVADTSCAGTTVIASNVPIFSAVLPTGKGSVDKHVGVISIINDKDTLSTADDVPFFSIAVRLGGGTK